MRLIKGFLFAALVEMTKKSFYNAIMLIFASFAMFTICSLSKAIVLPASMASAFTPLCFILFMVFTPTAGMSKRMS